MSNRSLVYLQAFVAAFLFALGTGSTEAASGDSFDGAWVIEGESCANVFTIKNGKMDFAQNQGTALPGVLINGDQIHGLTSTCSIASRKQSADTVKLRLHCESQIMFGDMTVSIKVKDADTISRVDPDFPDIATTYHRCK
ncbi:hypothetical protein GCM10007874_39350 [Labrys miyagiensis]|uniref:Uncharacterized protein n=1 Tax=Labrys miyagiensis TaxID=346912 RepID=A0ABQ6CMB7_9HYPH|nr:hypothetical protein [Labrys miyagiensis]GLS20918.1 hypothetical protein GCM10007874_39350 [Labrys miyagiensis]